MVKVTSHDMLLDIVLKAEVVYLFKLIVYLRAERFIIVVLDRFLKVGSKVRARRCVVFGTHRLILNHESATPLGIHVRGRQRRVVYLELPQVRCIQCHFAIVVTRQR